MDITQQLAAIAENMGCRYTLRGETISYQQVFSPTGLLPAFMRRADQLASFCLGYGLGLTFERAETATLGVVVVCDTSVPQVLRLLCITDVLYEFMHQASSPEAIALDDLLQE
jgi:intracellular multiplication protein IcmS